jgi:hypothetical protein
MVGLRLVNFWLDDGGRGCSSRRLIPVFRQGFTRQHDFVFCRTCGGSRRRAEARAFRAPMFAARLETAALLRAARFVVTAGFVRALIALGRCIFGRRQIASTLRAPSASTSTSPAKTSSPAIASTVAAEVLSTAAIVAFVATIRARIFLRGIELAKVLWGGSVRFRLALFRFGLRRAISLRLTSAVALVTQGLIVLMLVREIRVQRLLVRDCLLRLVIGA